MTVITILKQFTFNDTLSSPVWLGLAGLIVALTSPPTRGKSTGSTFPDEWSNEPVDKPRRDAGFWILRLLGLSYLAYFGLLLIGSFGAIRSVIPSAEMLFAMTYQNPFLALCTLAKLTYMIRMAFIGAFNSYLRWYTTLSLLVGHAVSVACSLLFYFVGSGPHSSKNFLLLSAVIDFLMVIAFIWILVRSGSVRYQFEKAINFRGMLSIPAMLLRTAFWVLGGLSIAMIILAFISRFLLDSANPIGALFYGPDPTLGNAITMYSVIGLVCFQIARNERLRDYLVGTLLMGYVIRIVGALLCLLISSVSIRLASGSHVDIHKLFTLSVVANVALVVILTAFRRLYYNVEFTITSFYPSSAQNVMSIHRALFPDGPEASGEVLQAIDRYAGTIRGRKRGILNFPFWFIENVLSGFWGVRPPFSTMSPEEQLYFLRHYLIRPLPERRQSFVPGFANFTYQLSVAAHSMVMFASYSSLKKHHQIGYVAPGARDRLQAEIPSAPPPFAEIAQLPRHEKDPLNYSPYRPSEPSPKRPAPRLSTPVNEPPLPAEVDYIVIGSGPGGAVMTYRLSCGDPTARILMIDRGSRYSPHQDFNDREIEMMAKVYKEGGLQQTKRADMSVLQGECVGGGSVINNAVCYKIPSGIKDRWQTDYGIPLDGLDAAYEKIGEELGIVRIGTNGINTKVAERFIMGVDAYNRSLPLSEKPLHKATPANVNAANVIGDGLWNLGNKYLRKRSMLETYIPWAESNGVRTDPGDLHERGVSVASSTTAVQFIHENGRATSVLVQTALGQLRRIKVRKAVVVAGGAIASSHFLMRSGVFRPVGKRMSCNFAIPVAFEFDELIRAYDGEQITMGAIDADERMVFETYFNPPSTFGLSLPFHFGRYTRLMDRYPHLLNFGVLIGSESGGAIVSKAGLINGQAFTWELGATDQQNIRYALTTLLRIGQEAGAKRVVIPLQPGLEFAISNATVEQFSKRIADYALSTGTIHLNTAHPQGGNLMAGSRASDEILQQRVVDETFKVVGYSNVFVADASVFPTSMNLNPQWTIMAMSSLASQYVLAGG